VRPTPVATFWGIPSLHRDVTGDVQPRTSWPDGLCDAYVANCPGEGLPVRTRRRAGDRPFRLLRRAAHHRPEHEQHDFFDGRSLVPGNLGRDRGPEILASSPPPRLLYRQHRIRLRTATSRAQPAVDCYETYPPCPLVLPEILATARTTKRFSNGAGGRGTATATGFGVCADSATTRAPRSTAGETEVCNGRDGRLLTASQADEGSTPTGGRAADCLTYCPYRPRTPRTRCQRRRRGGQRLRRRNVRNGNRHYDGDGLILKGSRGIRRRLIISDNCDGQANTVGARAPWRADDHPNPLAASNDSFGQSVAGIGECDRDHVPDIVVVSDTGVQFLPQVRRRSGRGLPPSFREPHQTVSSANLLDPPVERRRPPGTAVA